MTEPTPDNLSYISELSRLLHQARGGGGDGGASAWQQSVETRLGQLHEDMRQLRSELDKRSGGLIAALVLVAIAIVGGFAWMISRQDQQAETVARSLESLQTEVRAGRAPASTPPSRTVPR